MRILIIDTCYFTQLAIKQQLSHHQIKTALTIQSAQSIITGFNPHVILANLTPSSHLVELSNPLMSFFKFCRNCFLFIYLDTPYRNIKDRIRLNNNTFFTSKKELQQQILQLNCFSIYQFNDLINSKFNYSNEDDIILNDKEKRIIELWINETSIPDMVKTLQISASSIHFHKQKIKKKIAINNRIELIHLFNILKYLYYPKW